MLIVEAPKVERKILPSLTPEQLGYLIEQADTMRDKAIISLFADSGLRLSELANINPHNIDWQYRLIKLGVKAIKKVMLHSVKGLKSYSRSGYHNTIRMVVTCGV